MDNLWERFRLTGGITFSYKIRSTVRFPGGEGEWRVRRTSGEGLTGRLQAALGRAGITQREFAAAVGATQAAVSQWLSGKKVPSRENVRAAAGALGVTAEWLEFGVGPGPAGGAPAARGRTPARRRRGAAAPVAPVAEPPSVITQIGYPAYMANRNWDIEWINEPAERLIFGSPVRKAINVEDRHFFKLLFAAPVREMVSDFEGFVKSHLALIREDIPVPGKNPLLARLPREEVSWLERLWPTEAKQPPPIDCRKEPLRFRRAPVEGYHRVAALFREGTLIIWIPGVVSLDPVLDLLTGRQHVITDLLMHKLPALQSMAVLVADLQGSVKICADLPPEEYFELITEIWGRLERPFRQYAGSSGKHVGDGVVRYFLAKHDHPTFHIINALLCADAIRQCLTEIDAAWRLKKHWLNRLVLNAGLHEGRDWFGYIPTLPTPEFTALGDTVNIAARLSDVARDGAIWVTKHFLSALPAQVREHVVYGIRRGSGGDEHFIPQTYSRVLDLPDQERIPKSAEIANLSVTEVIRLDAPPIQEYARAPAQEGDGPPPR